MAFTALFLQPDLAQKPTVETPGMLVVWYGVGGVPLPAGPDWELTSFKVYDKGGRPIAQFTNKRIEVIASFIIFENLSGKPTPEGCRTDVMSAIRKGQGSNLSRQSESEMSDGHGGHFAVATHFTKLAASAYNHDIFAFAGSAKTCAEIHVSTIEGHRDEGVNLEQAIAEFHPDLSYQPAWIDYMGVASAIYETSPMESAPYFDSALKAMPTDLKEPAFVTSRRLATDVVVVALERMGNSSASREYALRAIKADPDYPMFYYHLACMDAVDGKAGDAQLHLQQAFDRRSNMDKGEALPDPTKDVSILKLKKDKAFWAFVESLPKS